MAVPTPSFADDAPSVAAIVAFGPVRSTGRLAGMFEDVGIGDRVAVDVGRTGTCGERVLTVDPVDPG